MSSSSIPTAANNASINAIKWNDPVQPFVPTCLKPANWCGRQWQKITNLDGKNACSKMCQVILRVVPAIFLSLATVFAFVIGFMGSCVSAKPVEYTVVNLNEVFQEEMVELTGCLVQNLTEDKIFDVLNALDISDALMEKLNKESVAQGGPSLTVYQCKMMLRSTVLPIARKALEVLKETHQEMTAVLAQKKTIAELKKRLRRELEPNAKKMGPSKSEAKGTPDAKKEEKTEVSPKDIAKADVKAQSSVMLFGQPRMSVSIGDRTGMFEVASQVKVRDPFQRVANAFRQGAEPTVSDIAKVAFLDGFRKIQADALMNLLSAEVVQNVTSKMEPPVAHLLTKLLPEFVCQKVLPALIDAIEPTLLDLSSRDKVALWAQNVSSVKLKVKVLSKGEEPMFKVIVS